MLFKKPADKILLNGQTGQRGRIGGASEEGGGSSKCYGYVTLFVSRWKFIKKSWKASESNTSLAWIHWRTESEQEFEEEEKVSILLLCNIWPSIGDKYSRTISMLQLSSDCMNLE